MNIATCVSIIPAEKMFISMDIGAMMSIRILLVDKKSIVILVNV